MVLGLSNLVTLAKLHMLEDNNTVKALKRRKYKSLRKLTIKIKIYFPQVKAASHVAIAWVINQKSCSRRLYLLTIRMTKYLIIEAIRKWMNPLKKNSPQAQSPTWPLSFSKTKMYTSRRRRKFSRLECSYGRYSVIRNSLEKAHILTFSLFRSYSRF